MSAGLGTGSRKFIALTALCVGAAGSAPAGELTLTATGISEGFTLSTFLSDASFGSVGAARLGNGTIVVKNYGDDSNYVFADVDGQTASSYLFRSSVGGHAGTGMAELNGVVYTIYSDGGIRTVNDDGTLGAVVSDVANWNGLAASAQENALYAGSPEGVYRIDLSNPDPAANATLFATGFVVDGITVSQDGRTVYITDLSSSVIRGYDTSSGLQNYTSPSLEGRGPDGVGVIAGGAHAGSLVVNNNNGTVALIDLLTNRVSTLASGGDRGDLVGFDTGTGSLLLTMGAYVYRLGMSGATIGGGGGGTGVPEPATLGLLGLGLAVASCRDGVRTRLRYRTPPRARRSVGRR